MKSIYILLFAVALFVGAAANAQEPLASIAGTVKDASTKRPLVEAVITVSSPEFEGKRLAVTDSAGNYKVANLPAGIYTVVFEMEGYTRFVKDNLRVSKGMPMGVSLEMVRVAPAAKGALAAYINR